MGGLSFSAWTTPLSCSGVLATGSQCPQSGWSVPLMAQPRQSHCHSTRSSWFLHGRKLHRGVVPGGKCHRGNLEVPTRTGCTPYMAHQPYPVRLHTSPSPFLPPCLLPTSFRLQHPSLFCLHLLYLLLPLPSLLLPKIRASWSTSFRSSLKATFLPALSEGSKVR